MLTFDLEFGHFTSITSRKCTLLQPCATYWMALPFNNLGWNYGRKLQMWPNFIDLWPYRLTFHPWCVLKLLFCLFLIFSPNLIAIGHVWQKLWARNLIFRDFSLWPLTSNLTFDRYCHTIFVSLFLLTFPSKFHW